MTTIITLIKTSGIPDWSQKKALRSLRVPVRRREEVEANVAWGKAASKSCLMGMCRCCHLNQ